MQMSLRARNDTYEFKDVSIVIDDADVCEAHSVALSRSRDGEPFAGGRGRRRNYPDHEGVEDVD